MGYSPQSVKVGPPKEPAPDKPGVALVPDTATRLSAASLEVNVESGAGSAAYIPDDAYQQAGAKLVKAAAALLGDADAVLKVQAPSSAEVELMKRDAVLISFLQPATQGDIVQALAARGVTAFSLELVPRISRAQSMDALSSQASAAGYKPALLAAGRLGEFFPLTMTAAGPVPLLVTGEMVKGMRPGSVIVDLAAETGGNVELTKAGKDVEVGGVTIIGTRNVPSTMPLHASQLYARNVANLLLHLVKDGAIVLDFEDEITKGSCVTHGGEIVNERAKQMVAAAAK